jgi:large subunit ribosomal protein L13
VPNPEYSKIPFDPNVRTRMDEIPYSMVYRALDGAPPIDDPQSCYVSVNHKGQRWHLFNAARFPLGRMATQISHIIRGKDKPIYEKNKDDAGDVCVVVNAANVKVTGRKKLFKMYRHHTGYPSGLKEITLPKLLEKDPHRVIRQAVKGMLPKNRLRETTLSKFLVIHNGPHHPHLAQKLPQFMEPEPKDINDHFSVNNLADKEKYEITFATDPTNLPEELKDLDVNIDEQIDELYHLKEKTHTMPKTNLFLAKGLRQNYRALRKYRKHKK